MKKAINIVLSLGLVSYIVGFIFCIIYAVFAVKQSAETDGAEGIILIPLLFSVGLIFMIPAISLVIPMIVSIVALVVFNKKHSKSEIKPMAIVTLIMGNLIAGIMMLCIKDSQMNPDVIELEKAQ